MSGGAPLGSAQAHQLRHAEARWLQSARDRLRGRPARRTATTAADTPLRTADDSQESR